jgi:hypothetical protein
MSIASKDEKDDGSSLQLPWNIQQQMQLVELRYDCCLAFQDMEEEYKGAKDTMKEIIKAAEWSATPESTFDEFIELLEGSMDKQDKVKAMREAYKKTYFEEQVRA